MVAFVVDRMKDALILVDAARWPPPCRSPFPYTDIRGHS